MSCAALSFDGSPALGDVLRSVDCTTKQATAVAFDRLFGAHGALSDALTLALTLYVGLLALNLLTGRSTLRLSLLTPRALTLGLVLTFATSWVAYQQVVWNLAAGAPDEIARLLVGSRGSALDLFAGQLDRLFAVVTEAAAAGAPTTDAARKTSPVAPSDLLWFASLLLMLGTAGVLLTTKITLAALLAIGPVFVVLALFGATRGLFEGWLRATVLFAIAPMLTVLVGEAALLLMNPLVQSLATAGSTPSMQLAVGMVLAACVFVALMAIALKAAIVMTGSLRLPRHSTDANEVESRRSIERSFAGMSIASTSRVTGDRGSPDERLRQLVAATRDASPNPMLGLGRSRRPAIVLPACSTRTTAGDDRTRGIGSRPASTAFEHGESIK